MARMKTAMWLAMVGALGLCVPTFTACSKKSDDASSDSDKDKDKGDKKKGKKKDSKGDDDDGAGSGKGAGKGKKKKGDDDDDSKSKKGDDDDDKSKKGDDDDDKAPSKPDSAPSGSFTRGDALKHMPSSCETRMYLDVGGLVQDDAIKSVMPKLDDKIAQSIKGDKGEKAEKALAALQKAGIDPGRDLKEVAFCQPSGSNDPVIALAGDFGGKDVLAALQQMSNETEGKALKKKEVDGVSYLQGDDDKTLVGLVTPNILVLTKNNSDFGTLKKESDVDDGWGFGKDRIFTMATTKKQKVNAYIADKGDNLEVSMTVEGKSGSDLDPKTAKANISKMLDAVATKLEKTPAKAIAADLKTATVDVNGNDITITAKIPNKDFSAMLTKIADADESDLEKIQDQ